MQNQNTDDNQPAADMQTTDSTTTEDRVIGIPVTQPDDEDTASTASKSSSEETAETSTSTQSGSETNQAISIMQIENMINGQMVDIDKVREEMKMIKSSYDDAFLNDKTYRDLEDASKKAAKEKNNYKQQMMKDPALNELSNKLDGFKSELKDMQGALSDYLREYNRVSGMTQFETKDGEVLQIINVFKLVKKQV